MAWVIRYSEQFEEWWDGLTRTVDSVVGTSRHHNMKELRASKGGALRVLFIFDPLRRAVFLVGGDKTGQWNRWYAETIPVAEEIYDRYLQDEGLI